MVGALAKHEEPNSEAMPGRRLRGARAPMPEVCGCVVARVVSRFPWYLVRVSCVVSRVES
jgi:hypothetical protein